MSYEYYYLARACYSPASYGPDNYDHGCCHPQLSDHYHPSTLQALVEILGYMNVQHR